MDNKKIVWDIRQIFTYDRNYQEHCGDGVIYYDCELLIDFGPFKKGHECHIYIDSATSGDFTMYIGCDKGGHGGKLFVPQWTYLDSDDENI